MTNREKMIEIFPNIQIFHVTENELKEKFIYIRLGDVCQAIDLEWWNAEYKEPTTKNDLGVDTVSRKAVHDMLENLPITVEDKWFNWLQKACMRLAELPSVTPQLSSELEKDSKKLDGESDCVSRQAVLEQAEAFGNGSEPYGYYVNVEDIQALPSVTPRLCEDAISRQALLNATVNKNSIWNKITDSKGENLEAIISKLPPITPQSRKGKWITYLSTAIEDFYQCSECGRMVHVKQTDSIKNYPYCHCGADMRGEEE